MPPMATGDGEMATGAEREQNPKDEEARRRALGPLMPLKQWCAAVGVNERTTLRWEELGLRIYRRGRQRFVDPNEGQQFLRGDQPRRP